MSLMHSPFGGGDGGAGGGGGGGGPAGTGAGRHTSPCPPAAHWHLQSLTAVVSGAKQSPSLVHSPHAATVVTLVMPFSSSSAAVVSTRPATVRHPATNRSRRQSATAEA
ncbi:hypothetical protein TcG_11439 [Trypanosoma cruzi]|nr:hypothetical protein TcG_11439 [Trypanosoma cruzi]